MDDEAERDRLPARAARVPERFSGERYPMRVLELCADLCGAPAPSR